MPLEKTADPDVTRALLDAISAYPIARDVTHCGTTFQVSPFDIYSTCPACAKRIKVRSFAAVPELEDVFDAVFAWMAQPRAAELIRRRQQELSAEDE